MPSAAAYALLTVTGVLFAADRPPPPLSPARDEAPHARPRLVCETEALIPGREAMLALDFEIEKGWHLYWDGLNDSGLPPRAQFALPPGFEVGEVQWPAPHRHVLPGGILDHIYEKRATLLVPLRVPADAAGVKEVELVAELDWLVCDEICLPESTRVSITLPIATTAGPGPDADRVRAARESLPKPLSKAKGVKVSIRDGVVTFLAPGSAKLAYYPGRVGVPPADPIADCETRGERMSFPLKAPVPGHHVQGILAAWSPSSEEPSVYSVDEVIPAPDGAEHSPTPGVPPAGGE